MARPEQIALLGYPVRVGEREREHQDEVVREFQLSEVGRPDGGDGIPARLLALVHQVEEQWSAEQAEATLAKESALARGAATVDLRYPAGERTGAVLQAWTAMWVEVDAHCATDGLLALAAPDDVVALRTWVLAEFLGQLDGQAPVAWSGPV